MDSNKSTQSKGNQSDSSTRTCEPDSETYREYQESGNIQEVEVISFRDQETKEANGIVAKNILKSNPEKCDVERNSNCKHSNSVCSEKDFPVGETHCTSEDKTAAVSKSNIHLLKKCSVVLNRCDEKSPNADALPEIKSQITRPVAGNGKSRNARFAEETFFRKKMIDSDTFVTMLPENESKCTNMDVDNSDFFNERHSQVSSSKDSSCSYIKRTILKSAKSVQKESICTEISEGQLKNENVLFNATGEELKKIHWKCKNSIIGSGQVGVINTSKKEPTKKNKVFSSDTKSTKPCAILPKTTSEPASRRKIAARRSSRRSNLKKHPGKEMNEDLDITEIIPTDPLLDTPPSNILNNAKETGKLGSFKNNAIVVNNTEQLLQVASRKGIKRKKEPTLIIIDTNSILSGKGPVPISQISLTGPLPHSSVVTGYSVLPTASGSWNNLTSGTSSQTVLQSLNQLTFSSSDDSNTSCTQISPLTARAVYIIDTPSLTVPRLYEQPPKQSFKKYIEQLQREIETSECTSKSGCSKDNSKNEMKTINNEKNANLIQNNKKKKCDAPERHIDESHSAINYVRNVNHNINKKKTSTIYNGNAINNTNSTISPDSSVRESMKVENKINTFDQEYFSSSLGTFFFQIGLNLVKEYVNIDLKQLSKEDHSKFVGKTKCSEFPPNNLDYRVEDNQPFHFKQKKCDYCNFQTESCLVMSHHLETPHLFNNVYKCNFCNLIIENRSQIVYHMIMLHDIRVTLECAPAPYQCPNCPFEDRSKSKLNSHKVSCLKKNKPDRNQEPPSDWEPPAKIRHLMQHPVSKRGKNTSYQMNSIGVRQLLPKLPSNTAFNSGISAGLHVAASRDKVGVIQSQHSTSKHLPVTGMWQRPNISITPLSNLQSLTSSASTTLKQGLPENCVSLLNKPQKLNICEICDSQFTDFENLQIHLKNIHHVKFSKKATYSTPSLGCQKCPLRFFTDQGLERHLLGAHGLVTASFQEASKNETDGGHCPICTKLFQSKLLEHMYREHKMSLKPVNISYKCTLCTTVTFEKYKQFEDHVFSVHSQSKKKNSVTQPAPFSGDILKSLTKNNEITIISHEKQNCPKNRGKNTNTISLIQQRKKLDVNVPQFKMKTIVKRHEEKERSNNLTPEEINIDSSCEEEKCVDKDTVTKKNMQNNEMSEDEKEQNSLKDTSNYSYKSETLVTDNQLLQDKRNCFISAKSINNEDTQKCSSTASTILLNQQTHESCKENEKGSGFLDSKSQIQSKNKIEENKNSPSTKEAPHQVCNEKSSTNECEMPSSFSDTNDAIKSDNETNYQEIKYHKEASERDDSAFVHKRKDSEHVPHLKMKCLNEDCNKLHQELVEIIDLDDSPTKEKINMKDGNSEVSKNPTSINTQNENNSKKNENQVLEENQTKNDTPTETAKFETFENESVLSQTNLDDDFLPNHIPSTSKIYEEMNSNYAQILPQNVEGIEVIQLDDSLPEDKKEIEETGEVLSQ